MREEYPHPGPYIRLRILYNKQKKYKDAIRACQAFIQVEQRQIPGAPRPEYPDHMRKFKEWIPKLRAKLSKAQAR